MFYVYVYIVYIRHNVLVIYIYLHINTGSRALCGRFAKRMIAVKGYPAYYNITALDNRWSPTRYSFQNKDAIALPPHL